jgi:hypothetical protein
MEESILKLTHRLPLTPAYEPKAANTSVLFSFFRSTISTRLAVRISIIGFDSCQTANWAAAAISPSNG